MLGAGRAPARHRRRRQDVEVAQQLHLSGRSDRSRAQARHVDVHRSEAHSSDRSRARRGQSGLHLPRCLQSDKGRSRSSKSAIDKASSAMSRSRKDCSSARTVLSRSAAPSGTGGKSLSVHEIIIDGTAKGRAARRNDGGGPQRDENQLHFGSIPLEARETQQLQRLWKKQRAADMPSKTTRKSAGLADFRRYRKNGILSHEFGFNEGCQYGRLSDASHRQDETPVPISSAKKCQAA